MQKLSLLVKGTPRPVVHCPVSVRVDLSARELDERVLVDPAVGMPVAFQAEPVAGGAVLHWMVDALGPGQERQYVLSPAVAQPTSAGVKVLAETDGQVDVRIGGELFTRYLYGGDLSKPCLYPLIGPYGQGVTRAYPQEEAEGDTTDHIHHRSVWVSWGDVNGSDNWSEEEGHGRMVHRYFDATESGAVFGRIVSLNDWVDDAGASVMQDRLEYRFYNAPPNMRLFDLDVTLYASERDVRFGDTKEGGIISFRMATPLDGTNTGCIRNSVGGVTEAETWGKRASWCDYSGELAGHAVGISVFDHPSNLRYPTYWHVRDYGLMTANPFGLSYFVAEEVDGSYVLPAGQNMTFRYRVLIHAGEPQQARVADKYLEWIFPPSVTVAD